MPIGTSRFNRAVFAVVALLLLGGCASLKPVHDYASETEKLTAAFEPMLAGSYQSCTDKYIRKKLVTSRHFDAAAAQKAAMALCGSIDKDNETIADLNSLLGRYATTLKDLADEKVPSYSEPLGNLKGSLGELKNRNTGEAFIDADQVNAVVSLADHLARLATKRVQHDEVKRLLAQKPAVFAIVDAMKTYAQLNYRSWLADEIREISILRSSLDASAESEPLAANSAKSMLMGDETRIAAQDASISRFLVAADTLKSTHETVLLKIDYPSDAELAKQLIDYANDVAALRKQLRKAYAE